MKNANIEKCRPGRFAGSRNLAGGLLLAFSLAAFGADIPVLSDTPIANTTSVLVKPNLMLLMDTSNSMKFSHMPDEIEIGSHRPLPGADFEIGYKSYQCNILYYKPTQTYSLPKDSTGATLPLPAFTAAYYNAYAEYTESPLVVPSTVVDLSTSFRAYDATTRQYPTSVDAAQPAYYYIYTSSNGAEPTSLNYASWPCTVADTGATTATTNPNNGAESGTWTRVDVSTLTVAQKQNFAIWYSYYRTRISMIKSAVSLSFTPVTGSTRVGFITVKPYAALVPTVGASVDAAYYLPIGDFASTHRRDWYAKLFSQVPGGSSPAREGLARVGRHYAGKQDSINVGMTGDPVQYSCQKNFTIMTTDGYWNTAAETRGPVALDGSTLVGQRDGWLNETKVKPGSETGETFNITPRPIWDGYPDTRRVKTEKLLEYTLEDCTSLYGPQSTIQNLQSTTQNLQSTTQMTQSTIQKLQSTAQNLQSTVQNLESTAQNLQSTVQNRESTTQNLQSTVQNLESTAQNLQSTTQNRESTTQNLQSTLQNRESTTQNRESTTQTLRSTNQNLQSTVQNLQNTSQILQTTSQNTQRTEQITQSTTQNLQSTVQNRESTTQNLQSTLQNRESTNQNLESTVQNRESTAQNLQSTLQNRESTNQNLESTVQNRESTAQNLQSTLQNRESTTQNLESTAQNLKSTNQNRESTTQNLESTTQNLESTTQNLYRDVQVRRTTVQWFQYDSSTELSTPVQTCTPGGNISCQLYVNGALVPSNTPQPYASVPVASCAAQTAGSGNAWLGISCTTVYSPSSTPTPIQTCTATTASAGNSYTARECTTNNTTNVPVASCTPQTAAAGNNWVTRTCPAPVVTTNVPVQTCTAQTAAAGNSWVTRTCSTNNTTNVPVASCTPQTAAAGNNWVTRTCPAPVVTTNVPVQTCTPDGTPNAGNNYTTTTCSTNNTTNVPTASCTPQTAAAGNSWVTRTCPAPIVTTNVPVASCTPQTAAAGNSWVTRTCSPVSTGPTPVQTCTAVTAAVGNSWTATTCSTNNTTNVPVASCTPQTAAAGNNWVTRTCPAPVTTTNVPVSSCTPQTAAAGNSWVTRTCPAPIVTTNVPVASCTPQTAAAGNNWVTRTCSPVSTGPTPVQTCTAVAAAAGNSWTATTCSTNNTTNVPVQTCTPQTAAAGNNWVTRTCSTNNTTNVPVSSCTPQTAAAGNNWVTRTCPAPIVTTNVPVATCTPQTAAAGNNWVTRTCSPVSTGPTPVQTCTAVTAAAGNSWTATTCSTNNTTNVPVASCTPQTAAAGNNWVTRTCPAPVTTTNVPVQTCTAAAAAAGNNWTTTTCSTNNTTNVPVASCTPQTAAAGNSWVTRTCTGPTILSGPTVVQTCTAVAASAGNGYVATVCGVITNTVPVQTCTPQTPTAGNNWTTITCANNNTTNVPVATCTPQTAAAGNNWTTITCPPPNVTTNVPVATCTASAANAGNSWTTTTCPAPVTTGPTPVQTCTAAAAAAGNSYTTTTCTPNNTTNVPVQTCTPQTAAAGNNWVTRTCSTNNTTNVPVASCTPQTAAAGNNWVTRTCPAPVTTTNVPVQTCTAAAAAAGNNWTTTTCSTNNTTNVPVLSCTPQTAAAGNSWVTRTCPAPVTTGPTPVQTCAAVAASAGNSWTATTCSTNNTSNVPVASCTPQTAAAGNNWVTRTCPAAVTTTNVPVQTCSASAAAVGNNWTTTTCSTNNTTNVPVASCTPQTAAAGNSWVTRTCPAPVTTTNVPVQTCSASAAAVGNSWTTTTCSTNNTTNVPVASCTPQTAAAGNNWVTRTCPTAVTTTNVPVQTCTAAAAAAGNSWTTTTCSTNDTTNVPVANCAAQTATAGNSWVTITCPAPVTTGPVGVSSCSTIAASAGNNWTATTCAPNNTTDVPVQTCNAEAASAGNSWTTTSCSTNNTTNVPVASCSASAASAGNAWVTTTCPPPVTTSTPEMYNCVAQAATALNNWTETLCGPRLPGKEQKSRVGTRTTTDILSSTTLISSTVSPLTYNPASGYAVTDGVCTPLASTLVPPPTQTPDGPATTTQITPPAVPANVPGPPATNYVQTCEGSGASWPCTLDEIKDAGSYNSLADVAQYYYVTDLRNAADGWPASSWDSTLDANNKIVYDNDNVLATATGLEDDRVNWQHMTTYTIGLGVSGTIAYDKNYKSATVGDFADLRSGTKAWPVWPDPTLNYAADGQLYSNPKSIDDFWHTAVNGRGKYFSAGNPADVIDGLRDVLRDLDKNQGSGAAAASSSQTPVQGNNIAFIGKYSTSSWIGDIEAREIDLTTGAVKSTVLWSAASKLNARTGYYCDDRKIMLFRGGATNNLVDFKWNTGTCTTVTVPENTTQTITVAGTVTSVSLDLVTYPDPNNPPKATAQTGALVPRELKVGDAILANDSVVTSAGAVVTIEQVTGAATTLNASEQAAFGSAKVALFSQYPDMSDGTSGSPDQRGAADDDALVNFLRGQRAREGFVAKDPVKLYRKREGVLGDIVDAQPVFVQAPFAAYSDTGYQTFKTDNANRKSMIYAAANDGMLHAFYGGVVSVDGNGVTSIDSTGGREAWAFIPTAVLGDMYKLADYDYGKRHTFLVDGTPTVGDVYDTTATAWKTVLVAGLNKGGKAYYALDVTDPDNPKALWEFKWSSTCYSKLDPLTHGADCHLGYSFGKPIITKMKNGQWVALVTSGYSNHEDGDAAGRGKGYLYVLDAITGKILSKISTGAGDATTPSGLAQITNYVDNALVNNTTKYVYGGDNDGNVWRFDIYDDPATVADESSATLIGIAKDSTGRVQPITTRPELGEIAGKPWIFVGTGRLLGLPDLTDVYTQSVYGFVDITANGGSYTADYPDPTNGGGLRDELRQLTLSPKTDAAGKPAAGATRSISCSGATCSRKSGWVVDLIDDGERMNIDMSLTLGTLIFASNVPRNTACSIGGYSWLNFVDYRTGQTVEGATAVSVALGDSLAVGLSVMRLPSSTPGGQGKTVAVVMGSSGVPTTASPPVNVPPPIGRRVSWREIAQ